MKWIDIQKKRPNPEPDDFISHIHLLVFDGKRITMAVCKWIYGNSLDPIKLRRHLVFHTFCKNCLEGDPIQNITHWMPLPKKPKK